MPGGSEPASFDLSALGEQLRYVAEDLRHTGDQIQHAIDGATAGEYTAASPDDLVRVTVDGRCRVSDVRLHAYLMRETPETVDRLVTATLNDALGQARTGSRQALLDALPPRMRTDVEDAMDEARRANEEAAS